MKNSFHFLYVFTGFASLCNDTCPLVPQAASPCPSAMGFASGECRAGLAGGRACMAGGLAERLRHFTPEDRPKASLKGQTIWKVLKKTSPSKHKLLMRE
jgi:hypothetical protein